MAMGQSEQRAIHPFFQRDFGGPTKPIPHNPVSDNLLPIGNPICETQDGPDARFSTSCNFPDSVYHGSLNVHHPTSVTILEQDPNASRRKRRKTSNPDGLATQNNTPSSDHETPESICDASSCEISTPPDSATPHAPTSLETSSLSVVNDSQAQQPASESYQGSQDVSNSALNNDELKTKRKIIKLNANGKLLSSPIADKFRDKGTGRKGTKRGKSTTQKTEDRRPKLVIIKYGNNDRFSDDLGQHIDMIIGGKKVHVSSSHSVKPPALTTTSSTNQSQPPKPTHPFFMKKPTRKPDPSQYPHSTTQPGGEDPKGAESPVVVHPIPNSTAPSSTRLSLSFGQRLHKFPEPIEPVWPPKGLTHVRASSKSVKLDIEEFRHLLRMDQRKSKMAAISINDEENVLTSVLRASPVIPSILRVPCRQITSGRALQETMRGRLSEDLSADNDKVLPHPAIKQLYSSLTTSMTAFDRGHFDTHLWTQKYAPSSAQQVLCATKEALMLRDWLKNLVVSTVDTGKPSKDNDKKAQKKEERKKKRRKKSEKLDGFIVSSGDEASEMGEISGSDDELAGSVTTSSNKKTVIRTGNLTFNLKSGGEKTRMSNAILLSGPWGCGKTASVYAVAKELDFEVFEINAGNRRSARDIVDRVGDMTQNHLVHNMNGDKDQTCSQLQLPKTPNESLQAGKQNQLMGFFKPALGGNSKKINNEKPQSSSKETITTRPRTQKQSLILLEEADLLFEEDKQFWSGVLTVINQSKRPIIITCNDESLIPLDEISFHAILRYRASPRNLAVDYLLLIAANEGHVLEREPIETLYKGTGNDLRRSICELNFWCQMTIGSEKSGLDWMIERWPPGSDLDSNGEPLRVLSLNTYRVFMGWFGRDQLTNPSLGREIESRQEAFHWWQLGFQDSEDLEGLCNSPDSVQAPNPSRLENLDNMCRQCDLTEARSVLDILATHCTPDTQMDVIDTSMPPIPEKRKSNYVEGYQLLEADLIPEYSSLSTTIGATFEVLIGKTYRPGCDVNLESTMAAKVLANNPCFKAVGQPGAKLYEALAPMKRADYVFPLPVGRLAPSFENGLKPIAEDLGPYIRAIVSFDVRLEQYRLQLSGLLSGDGKGTKRARTTRASRAALEGGNKAETRKERWFCPEVNPSRVLATGKKEWQDVLISKGYFPVASVEGDSVDNAMEGSGI